VNAEATVKVLTAKWVWSASGMCWVLVTLTCKGEPEVLGCVSGKLRGEALEECKDEVVRRLLHDAE